MTTRKTAQAAVKVYPEMLAHLNAQIAAISPGYYFCSNARGTLTYFRRYEGVPGAGYSVPRSEVEGRLRWDGGVSLATMVAAAIAATCPTVEA